MYKLNEKNKIMYPSIYEINYNNRSKFNTNLINNKFFLNIKRTKIFNLESLNICDLKNWNDCFKLVDIKYNKKKYGSVNDYLGSTDFCNLKEEIKREILKDGRIIVDYNHFGEVCCDIQKVFSGTFNYVGENFSKIPLVIGTIQNYLYQYISNCVFGYPNVFAAIQNMPEINNTIDSLPKKLISNLKESSVLQSFYHDFVEEICSGKEDFKHNFLFRKKNVIEFSLFIKSPNINFNSSDALKKYVSEEIVNIDIPMSLWKLYFILN
jgi:hypothetical protein